MPLFLQRNPTFVLAGWTGHIFVMVVGVEIMQFAQQLGILWNAAILMSIFVQKGGYANKIWKMMNLFFQK